MLGFLKRLDPSWKFALAAYLFARVALSAWSLVIFVLFPTVLQNLVLFGEPVLAVFDLRSGSRYVYARLVDGTPLTFRAGDPGYVIDSQTASVWSLSDGRAVSGAHRGNGLSASSYSVEDVFPYRGAAPETNPLLGVWQRFDANWYLAIAERGYVPDGSAVYFPLYPLLIRIVGAAVGDPMLAALLLSNVALIGGLAALYRVSRSLLGLASARRTVAYLLLFPTGFFLLGAYAESLFLLFALGAFFFALRDLWFYAALLGALAALTRLQGVLLIAPLAYLWWRGGGSSSPSAVRWQRLIGGAALLCIPAATLGFLTFTNLSLLSSYADQLHARFVLPWDNVLASLALLGSGRGSLIDALNLATTVGLGVMVIAIWRKLPRAYGLYALAMYSAPLFRMTTTQPLVSMTRYALVIFPVFMLWGDWGKNVWVNRGIVYLSFPFQLYLCAQFVLWGWVG